MKKAKKTALKPSLLHKAFKMLAWGIGTPLGLIIKFSMRYKSLSFGLLLSVGLLLIYSYPHIALTMMGLNSDQFEKSKNALMGNVSGKLQQVTVEGNHHLTDNQIIKDLPLQAHMPLLQVDLPLVQEILMKNGWIKLSSVRRIWPNQIAITLVERHPVAIWQEHKKYYLVDEEGVMIARKTNDHFNHLPLILGDKAPEKSHEVLSILTSFPRLAQKFEAARLFGTRYWMLYLGDNMRLKLPEQNVETRLNELLYVMETHDIDWGHFNMIDLRMDDRIIFRPNLASQPIFFTK